MVLLSMVGVRPEAIVEDYLATLRLGGGFALTSDGDFQPIPIEELLSGYGVSAEEAFRDALAGLDLAGLMRATALPEDVRRTIVTWRGQLQPG